MKQLLRKGISLAVILAASAMPCSAIGGFGVTNSYVGAFASWSTLSNVKSLVGDFDGDGMADVALTGYSTWGSIPLAVSNGDGTFQVVNAPLSYFPFWATFTDAKPLVGDFNGDGRSDIALLGPAAWNFVPIAFSNGDGTFNPPSRPSGFSPIGLPIPIPRSSSAISIMTARPTSP